MRAFEVLTWGEREWRMRVLRDVTRLQRTGGQPRVVVPAVWCGLVPRGKASWGKESKVRGWPV